MAPIHHPLAKRPRFVATGLALVALALTACGGVRPSGSPAASGAIQPQTIHLIVRYGSENYVHVGSISDEGCTGTCLGDIYLGNDPLTDATSGQKVGMLRFECFVIDVDSYLFNCPGNAIDLTGRGQIVFNEQVYHDGSRRPATAAITGGTGEFLGASGVVITTSGPNGGAFEVTITK